jgi:hypothetical protein
MCQRRYQALPRPTGTSAGSSVSGGRPRTLPEQRCRVVCLEDRLPPVLRKERERVAPSWVLAGTFDERRRIGWQ